MPTEIFSYLGTTDPLKSCTLVNFFGYRNSYYLELVSSYINKIKYPQLLITKNLIDGDQHMDLVQHRPYWYKVGGPMQVETTWRKVNLREASMFLTGFSFKILPRDYKNFTGLPLVFTPLNEPWDRMRDPEEETFRYNL